MPLPSSTGSPVVVDVRRVEKIPGGRSRPTRYRFHTDQGLYLTEQGLRPSGTGPKLTGRESGPFELVVADSGRAIAWRAL